VSTCEAWLSSKVQGGPEECSWLGLTCALLVRKHRELSLQIWSTYQDRSLSAIIRNIYSTPNLKTKGSTPTSSFKARHEDLKIPSSYTKEEMTPSQQKLPEKPWLFRTSISSWEPSDSHRIFLDKLDSLTLLTLKVSRQGFDKILSVTSTLQPSTAASEDNLHLRQMQVFYATQSVNEKLEDQPFEV
jgi:hypothetical protein